MSALLNVVGRVVSGIIDSDTLWDGDALLGGSIGSDARASLRSRRIDPSVSVRGNRNGHIVLRKVEC